MKFSGNFATGAQTTSGGNGESFYEYQLKIKSKRQSNLRTVAKIRGESDDSNIQLRDAYLDYKDETKQITFGLSKKIMGMEYWLPKKDRPLYHRTLIYNRLSDFGYIGRQMQLTYETKANETRTDTISAGYSEAQDAHILLAIRNTPDNQTQWYSWLLLQSDRIDDARQNVWANVNAIILPLANQQQFTWETALGVDPFKSEYEFSFGTKKRVHFYATKLQWTNLFNYSSDKLIQPLAQFSAFAHDHRENKDYSLEFSLALNMLIEDLRLGVSINGIGKNNPETNKKNYDSSSLNLVAFYRF